MQHHFTVDVEEYYQVSAFEPLVSRESWGSFESRVERTTLDLVDGLGRHGHTGTFFVLGCVAERHPGLVRRIAEAGHEVASHGWDHRRVTQSSPEEFRASVRRSKLALEEIAGVSVLGFRAPSFSIVPGFEWALDVLIEEGYAYDSSIFPIRRPGYGNPSAPRDRHSIPRPAGTIEEFPLSTLTLFGARLPAAGGAYLRLLPDGLVGAALRQSAARGQPGMFYIHPWELDVAQPRIRAPLATRIRHYGGLQRTRGRIERLMEAFEFRSVASTLRSASDETSAQRSTAAAAWQ
jgi:polysaccharide deacetylase family protein (PEP-CTERM system associated)